MDYYRLPLKSTRSLQPNSTQLYLNYRDVRIAFKRCGRHLHGLI